MDNLVTQVRDTKDVELLVLDNASRDDTEEVVKLYGQDLENIRYFKNERNVGYSGNQAKCFERASGKYIGILSDDDVYTEGLVDDILALINTRDFSFIALNYYSFTDSIDKPYKVDFAPERDVTFTRAYDILNYPSVGHYSGFIFNSSLAKQELSSILATRPIESFEKYRGVMSDVAHRMLSKAELPSYFYGRRKLANRIPLETDYDDLNHQCLDYYEYFINLYAEGLIKEKDLEYRRKLVLSRLPRAIVVDSRNRSREEMLDISRRSDSYFGFNHRYRQISRPLLRISQFKPVRDIFRYLYLLVHSFKHRFRK